MLYYTSAPPNYDEFGTQTIRNTGYTNKRGMEFRAVMILLAHYDWQVARYGSGLHVTFTQQQFDLEIQTGFLLKTLDTLEDSAASLLSVFCNNVPGFDPYHNTDHALAVAQGIGEAFINSHDTSVNLLTLAQTSTYPDEIDGNQWAASFGSNFYELEEWCEPTAMHRTPFTARGRTAAEAISLAAILVAKHWKEPYGI